MSAPFSYASAARQAPSSKAQTDSAPESPSNTPPTAEVATPVSSAPSDVPSTTSPTDNATTVAASTPNSAPAPEPELQSEISSIRDKISLTPAPMPKVNAWGVKPPTATPKPSLTADEPPLDPSHWPKPEVVTEKRDQSAPTSNGKGKHGKGKWVPLNVTPITTKPRQSNNSNSNSNKSSRPNSSQKTSQNSTNGHNNNNSASTSNGASNNNGSANKNRNKNYTPKPGAPKKTDAKTSKPSQKTSSAPVAGNANKSDSSKSKAAPTSAPSAPGKGFSDKGSKAPQSVSNGSQQGSGPYNNFQPNPYHNNTSQQRSQSVPNQNQFIPHNNARRASQLPYTPKFFMPDYMMYAPMFNGAAQSPYDVTLSNIAYQVEYYFSVENLCKDLYLRKNMNSNGWIPLTVLGSFTRLKNLTRGDLNLFVEACKWAPSVEVLGDKIRARYNHQFWVLAAAERTPAGQDEESPAAPKLVFNPADAAPFVPKADSSSA